MHFSSGGGTINYFLLLLVASLSIATRVFSSTGAGIGFIGVRSDILLGWANYDHGTGLFAHPLLTDFLLKGLTIATVIITLLLVMLSIGRGRGAVKQLALFALLISARYLIVVANDISSSELVRHWLSKFDLVFSSCSLIFIVSFIRKLFPKHISLRSLKTVVALSAVFTLLVVNSYSLESYTAYEKSVTIYLLIVCVYLISKISIAIASKSPGAMVAIFGVSLFFAGTMNDIFVYLRIYQFARVSYITTFFSLASFCVLLINQISTRLGLITKMKSELENLKDLDASKTGFFRYVSHELRSPLSLILCSIENLKDKHGNDREVEVTQRNAKRLLKIVNQLLSFQRLSFGKRGYQLGPIEIGRFMENCMDYFRPMCEKKNINFSFVNKVSDRVYIEGHVDSLEKIVFNYLSNAFKYTPRDGTIEVKLNQSSKAIRVTVSDSGPGLSKEEQGRLFKLFSRVKENSFLNEEGSGLGLALVKELTELMNGNVGVVSQKGLGSDFWVEFPLFEPHEPILDVLVVEDEPDQLKLYEETLSDIEKVNSIKLASSVKEAREILDSHRVKCVIADAVIPGEDGVTFLGEVERVQPKCARVLVTGKATLEILEKAVNKSHIEHLVYKPWNRAGLIALIERLISKSVVDDDSPLDMNLHVPRVDNLDIPEQDDISSASGGVEDKDPDRQIEVEWSSSSQKTFVTSLHVDLCDFTKRTVSYDTEKMVKVLNSYMDTMKRIVSSYGGMIDNLVGDTLVVIFGAPTYMEKEKQAINACECAIRMQDALEELNGRWSREGLPQFDMRVGIDYGPAVVGYLGSWSDKNFTAVGGVISGAQSIMEAGSPGDILFSESIKNLLVFGAWEVAGVYKVRTSDENVVLYRPVCIPENLRHNNLHDSSSD